MSNITPYVPKNIERTAMDWMRGRNQPAFVLAYEEPGPLSIPVCPNCQGVGVLYVALAESGPWKAPGNVKTVSKWFEGNGQFGKGWYSINQTIAVECPECKNGKGGSK